MRFITLLSLTVPFFLFFSVRTFLLFQTHNSIYFFSFLFFFFFLPTHPYKRVPMQFSIEAIRSVRNNYREPPYPGFSLEEVVRRRKLQQTKLVRGDKAWVAKGTAQTTEEWVQRRVQSCLNKLSERNWDLIIDNLCTKELFETKEILENVVHMIFRKALDEPENSKLYARLCFQLSLYEVTDLAEDRKKVSTKNPAKPKEEGGAKPSGMLQSELRDTIVIVSQREFKEFRFDSSARKKDAAEEDLPEADRKDLVEHDRANFMRRKRANMRFVGELFLQQLLTYKTVLNITDVLLDNAKHGKFPESENIEIFTELLTTIGQKFESQRKADVNEQFTLLQNLLKNPDCPYSSRIRFKIMDLIDLRKCEWGAKPKAVKPLPRSERAKKASAVPGKAPAKAAEAAAPAGSRSWRDVASSKPTASAPAKAPLATSAAKAAAAAAPAKPPVNAAPLVPFELRVLSMQQEWVQHRVNDFIPEWMMQFDTVDREFDSAESLAVAVAAEVIKSACVTTRGNAQREAYGFLVVGLFLTDSEVLQGFASACAAAVEDGLLEDVPKYSERFMQMLRLTAGEEVTADVYYDAATVLRMAYNKITDVDDVTEVLMKFWAKVPPPPEVPSEEERIQLVLTVIVSLCEEKDAAPGLPTLLAALFHSMHTMGLVEQACLDEFCALTGTPFHADIVKALGQF
ncbi:eukaryotic translation initiation factor 4 gamma [Strigomonas culicis]|uniref:Eukaryotic translation initiation factor 4 gamma n=1 Tax=Strigomonas culicis TaxID=28005 RepID=S9VJF0_9TRYP|nr:eukaryotic translation initiation factor 4 gamma [Strigomonas culicis]|eukprot:EPY23350.1 eukaryotic translation initiation factor 4 gamma [Strigomonas culicis]